VLSTVSKSTTLDDVEGHYCVFDVATIGTLVYLFIIYTWSSFIILWCHVCL